MYTIEEHILDRQLVKQKTSIIVMICIVVMVGMIGFTYSFFAAEISSNSGEPTVIDGIKEAEETTLTINELYTKGQTKEYYIVVWISETVYAQMDRGTFTGTVRFNNHQDVATSPAETTLKNLGLSNSIKTDTPNFSKGSYSTCDTSTNNNCETTVGIYAAEDDLGTSYYFRGDVLNNYVYFANSYWRIIRINGDGTIRMIYDGTSAHANREASTDRHVNEIDFNSIRLMIIHIWDICMEQLV